MCGRHDLASATSPLAARFPMRLIAIAACLVMCLAPPSEANWLGRILQEAGEVGGRAGRHSGGALERAAAHVRSLPVAPKGSAALAAHATPEGHWHFANRAGETFTAGTPDELKRVVSVLAAEASGDGKLALYLSEDSVFAWRQHLKDLPKAELHVVVGKDAYPLARRNNGGTERLHAVVKPNIIVELTDRKVFDEALWQLARPLDKASIRVLGLEPGGPHTLPRLPKIDATTKRAAVDAIDPYKLPGALSSLKGQTALVTGRIEGDFLHFRAASGAERPILLKDLTAAAEASDVNLLILHSATPRQPGGRNWLWQRQEVAGLGDALKRATLSDFLAVLGANRGQLVVSAAPQGASRITMRAIPSGGSAIPLTGALGDWAREIAGNVTGNIVTSAVEAHVRNADRQREVDARLVPFLPATVQMAYIAALIAGLIGIAHAWRWWGRIWPPEQRDDYAGAFGYHAARATKGVLFLVLFLPVAGPFAFLAAVLGQAWTVLTLPARLVRRITGRRSAAAG